MRGCALMMRGTLVVQYWVALRDAIQAMPLSRSSDARRSSRYRQPPLFPRERLEAKKEEAQILLWSRVLTFTATQRVPPYIHRYCFMRHVLITDAVGCNSSSQPPPRRLPATVRDRSRQPLFAFEFLPRTAASLFLRSSVFLSLSASRPRKSLLIGQALADDTFEDASQRAPYRQLPIASRGD